MRRAAILVYHRVAHVTDDPYQLVVRPELFEAQLELLRCHCVPSRLHELMHPSPRPRVVVTFDDGYADNLHMAAGIASRLGVPMTVYVASGLVDVARGFWWDRLSAICLRLPQEPPRTVTLEIGPNRVGVRLQGEGAGELLRRTLHARLRRHRRAVIEDALDRLADKLGVDGAGSKGAPVLTAPELVQLARLDHVEIGAHTADHDLLTVLTGPEQEAEMDRGRKMLVEVTGSAIEHFAYPFGGADAFDRESMAAVQRLGFRTGVTTLPGSVHRLTPRHRLPRYVVHPADTPEAVLSVALGPRFVEGAQSSAGARL